MKILNSAILIGIGMFTIKNLKKRSLYIVIRKKSV